MLITLMIGFFNGLSIGIGIIMAKAFGSGNKKRMQEVVHNAAGLSVAGALILMVIGWIFSPAILKLMNTPERILELGAVYLRYYFICMGSVICFNSAAGILRALGNSRSPMICQFIGGIANVIGDFFFIYVFKMGVKGVALATLFSQTCACIVTVWHLFRLDAEYRLQVKQICIKKELTKEILAVGLPSGISVDDHYIFKYDHTVSDQYTWSGKHCSLYRILPGRNADLQPDCCFWTGSLYLCQPEYRCTKAAANKRRNEGNDQNGRPHYAGDQFYSHLVFGFLFWNVYKGSAGHCNWQ